MPSVEPRRAAEQTSGPDRNLSAALAAISDVEGWLTPQQAHRLWNCARSAPPHPVIVEIGSFRGRSTIVLARARPDDAQVIAIDPHAGTDRDPQNGVSGAGVGQQDLAAFCANLRRAGIESRVRHVRRDSLAALGVVDGSVDLLFVDGAHRYRPARDDITRWGARVRPGGTMLIHDGFNAIGVTAAQTRLLLLSRTWRYCGRSGSLAEYRRELLSVGAALTNASRQLAQWGYFARNLLIKGALVSGLRPLARVLGHHGNGWPH